jgi:hypothetical protein
MTIYTRPVSIGDVLLAELHSNTKQMLTLAANVLVTLGEVLGRILLGAAAAVAKVGNTGNGVFTMDPATPILAFAQAGVYAVRCIAAAANSGTFRVFDPQGRNLGDVVVGATFSNQIKFVVADGAVDFVVGDEFDVTIAAGSLQVTAWNPAATDGSQTAYAIALDSPAQSTNPQPLLCAARNATVEASFLGWPTGVSAANQAAATDSLDKRGITIKTGI